MLSANLPHSLECEISVAGQPVDLVGLSEKLASAGLLEKVGGAGYVAGVTDSVPTGQYWSRTWNRDRLPNFFDVLTEEDHDPCRTSYQTLGR